MLLYNSPDHLEAWARRYGLAVLAVAALALLWPGTAALPLIDRDEPRFAEATRQMLITGNWIVPFFNGEYRFDKPILTYWLMSLGYRIFGVCELGARVHSVMSAVALGWVVYAMGRRWFNARTGFLAALGLLTCFQLVMHGRSAVADMPMVVMVALAQWALFELLRPVRGDAWAGWGWCILLYGALAVGFLAKGPVAWLVPLLTAAFYRWVFWRRPLPWRNLHLLPGLLLMLALVGAWGVPALWQTHGQFWRVGMEQHVLERGIRTFAGLGYMVFYYFITAFISLFPWIAYAGCAWDALRRDWNERNAFLVSWLASTYLFFSFYFTQLPHYVMPAFPAFFLLLAQGPVWGRPAVRWQRNWTRAVLGIGLLVAVGVLLFASWAPFPGALAGLRLPVMAAAGCMLGFVVMGAAPWRRSAAAFALGMLLLMASLAGLGHGLRPLVPALQLQPLWSMLSEPTDTIWTRYTEPSLVFYSQRNWREPGDLAVIRARAAQPGDRVIILLEREWPLEYYFQSLARDHFGYQGPLRQRDFTAESATIPPGDYRELSLEGLNLARTSWVQLRVLYRSSLGNGPVGTGVNP